MSREIKFRAWSTPDNIMHNNVYIYPYPNPMVVGRDDKSIGFDGIDVVVMQYTGMKDKNGVEIYEGDILKQTYHNKEFGVVTYNELSGMYTTCSHSVRCNVEEDSIIKGNIYENPELIGDNND